MEILVCYNRGMNRHNMPLDAFASGAEARGNKVDKVMTDDFFYKPDPELVILFGSGAGNRGYNAKRKYEVLRYCEKKKIPYVKIEEAFIKRDEYWSVTINGLGRDGYYLHKEIESDRISNTTSIKPFKWSGDYILLTKQLPRDANVGIPPVEYRKWLYNMMEYLVQFDYQLVIREHPKIKSSKTTIEEDLQNARMLVTYSSTTAVDAAIAGVPFYVENPRSVVYDLRVRPKDIDGNIPSYEHQYNVLNEVAHAQWTLKEMHEGQCWDHLYKILKSKDLCKEK